MRLVDAGADDAAESDQAPTRDSHEAADREIRGVVRVFRLIGGIGAVLYVPMALVSFVQFARSLLTETPESAASMLIVSLVNGGLAALFVMYLRVAGRLQRRGEGSKQWALAMSYVLLLGFPLFTIVGILCIRRINKHMP